MASFKQLGPSFRPTSLFKPPQVTGSAVAPPPQPQRPRVPAEQWNIAVSQDRVDQLIRAYRVRGHLVAQIDPLGLPRPALPELELGFYGLTEADLDREFSTATIEGPQSMTLRRHHRAAAEHVLPQHRRAVLSHGRFESAAVAARTDGGNRKPLRAHAQRAIADS